YVFLISGIWHGANWTFLIWGALHALYNTVGNIVPRRILNFEFIRNNFLQKKTNQFIVFNLVLFAWIFFRASTVNGAFEYIINMFVRYSYVTDPAEVGIKKISFFALIGLALFFLLFDRNVHQFIRKETNLFQLKAVALFSVLVALVFTLGFWGKVQFIYFQF
ncbi:MAG: hypothetical protein ABIP51_02210, partial [Bacteroidia bacterium]